MIKMTRRQTAAFLAMTDEQIAFLWLAIDGKRTQKGQITVKAMRESEYLLTAANQRGLSLPCEGESLADWSDRMARRAAYPELYA